MHTAAHAVDTAVERTGRDDPQAQLLFVLEHWGLGPEAHIAAALSWVLRAHKSPKDILALDSALWYLARAVDKYPAKPFNADPNALAQTLASWGLTGHLRDAVSYLSSGQWVKAHLMLYSERELRGG